MLNEPRSPPEPDRSDPTRTDVGGAQPTLSAFVGRDAELNELRAGLETAIGGQSRLFLISGEPGIGKTRLAAEFTSEARKRGARVHWGRCWESGGAPPYWPWVEVIRQVLGGLEPTILRRLGRYGAHLAHLVPELAEQLGTTLDTIPPATDPKSARFFVFDAVAAVLRHAASCHPLVVIIDDFHAADRVSLLLLAFLNRTLADSPILLVGAYRDLEAIMSAALIEPLAELTRHARRLALRGLTTADVAMLIASTSGSRPSASTIADIYDASDGNPFFLDEILRPFSSEGQLGQRHAATPARGIPDGVREAVRRRLEPMPLATTALLELAAVAGREFDSAILRFATNLELTAVIDALEQPLRCGLVFEVIGSAGRFSFRHALIREAIYDGLAPTRRLRLHQLTGEAFATLSAGDPNRYVAELAHHFLAAAPCGNDERFIEHGANAARHAMRRMAFEEAVALYQRTIDALTYTGTDERRRCQLILALGEAKEWANDPRGSRAAAEEAAAIARRIGAADLLSRAALVVGSIEALKFTAGSRIQSAPNLIREALRSIPPEDTVTRARLLSRLALHSLVMGSRTDARDQSRDAVTASRLSSDSETIGHALVARYAVLHGPDEMEERCAIADEVLAIAAALCSREFAMRGLALRVTNLLELGEIKAADDAILGHARLADETGDPFERWVNLVWRGCRALMDGRFDEARDFSRDAFELTNSIPGIHAAEVNGPIVHAGLSILIQEAIDDQAIDLSSAGYYASRFPEIVVWRVVPPVWFARKGSLGEAQLALDALAARDFSDLERNGTWLAAMSYLTEAIEALNDLRRAAVAYKMLLPYAERNATISLNGCRGSVSRPLAILAATLGFHDEAARLFEAALEMNSRMGAKPLVAWTMFDYARVLVRRGDPEGREKARGLADDALHLASNLGSTGLARQCSAFLLRLRLDLASELRGAASDTFFHLTKEGQFWALSRAGRQILLKDAKGMTYLAELVRHPDRDIHALDLVALFGGTSNTQTSTSTKGPEEFFVRERSGFNDQMLDAKARRAYQRQLTSLQDQLAAAEAAGDPERTLELRQEIGSLRRELARATGLGGRIRQSSDAERARVSVTRTIRLALTRIVEVSPDLGGELARCIRTGTFCCYAPDRTSTS